MADAFDVKGRSIVGLLVHAVRLWQQFRPTLVAELPTEVVTALDAITAAIAIIEAINPEGPA